MISSLAKVLSGSLGFGLSLAWAIAKNSPEPGHGPAAEVAAQPDGQLVSRLPRPTSCAPEQALQLCRFTMCDKGIPGMVISVSVDGHTVLDEGLGYSDLENGLPCSPSAVMRIASISKSITMAAVAQLWQDGLLDMDAPVRQYVPDWPEHHPDITMRQLVSHLSGIRHYEKIKSSSESEAKSDVQLKEFYLKEKVDSVSKALDLFKDDPLLSTPGSQFHYTTHGYTLVSAVVESIAKEPFDKHMERFFLKLGLHHTRLDRPELLVPHRARLYSRGETGKGLRNAAYVDNSYKWAGGGFVSTSGDLVKFGNAMLYSYQCGSNASPPGILRADTMKELWAPVVLQFSPSSLNNDVAYGMGWVVRPHAQHFAFCRNQPLIVSHSGGAVGASSVLLIRPISTPDTDAPVPQGIVVAIICNLDDVALTTLAANVAHLFFQAHYSNPGAQPGIC